MSGRSHRGSSRREASRDAHTYNDNRHYYSNEQGRQEPSWQQQHGFSSQQQYWRGDHVQSDAYRYAPGYGHERSGYAPHWGSSGNVAYQESAYASHQGPSTYNLDRPGFYDGRGYGHERAAPHQYPAQSVHGQWAPMTMNGDGNPRSGVSRDQIPFFSDQNLPPFERHEKGFYEGPSHQPPYGTAVAPGYANSFSFKDRRASPSSYHPNDRPRRYHCARTYEHETLPASNSSHRERPGRDREMDRAKERSENKANVASIRARPRATYLQQAFTEPKLLDGQEAIDKHLPLLVLDLNGTLVFRGSKRINVESRSQRPTRRPYLRVFLQYCLGIPDTVWEEVSKSDAFQGHDEQQSRSHSSSTKQDEVQQDDNDSLKSQGSMGDEKEDALFEARMAAWSDCELERQGPSRQLHGAHFWGSKATRPPMPSPQANYHLLVWSSAQPQNVDAMTRAIFTPEQAAQLLRVLARDTLVPRRDYARKAQSIKDLEIVWAALNKDFGDEIKVQSKNEGERRLLADTRDEEDRASPDDDEEDAGVSGLQKETSSKTTTTASLLKKVKGAAWRSALRAEEFVIQEHAVGRGARRGWGPHNTLLLDDSTDKARLQPYNHLLVSEFDGEKARVFRSRKRDGIEEKKEEEETGIGIDDSLLQAIGVLEHAKRQRNISAWVKQGGLGFFGGLKQNGVEVEGDAAAAAATTAEMIEIGSRGPKVEQAGMKASEVIPTLDEKCERRTPSFWKAEGIKALVRLGIEPHVD